VQFDVVLVRAIGSGGAGAGPPQASAIVDPWGRVRGHQPLSATLAGVRPRYQRSIYNRIGDAFAFLCIAVTLVAVVSARRA
jgi:apolipoprotein N-acyltransferase